MPMMGRVGWTSSMRGMLLRTEVGSGSQVGDKDRPDPEDQVRQGTPDTILLLGGWAVGTERRLVLLPTRRAMSIYSKLGDY